jgi:hypothetical protein
LQQRALLAGRAARAGCRRLPQAVGAARDVLMLISSGRAARLLLLALAGGSSSSSSSLSSRSPARSPALQPRPMVWMAEGHTTTAAGVRSYNLEQPVVFFLRASDADLTALTADGATNLATIHPAYAPWKTAWNETAIRGWCRGQLTKSSVGGIALDHEGWTLQTPGLLSWLFEEAKAAGKVFIDVPKITLDHLIVGTHTFEQQVALLERYTHGSAAWIYSYNGSQYLDAAARWRAAGYTKPFAPMGDGGYRPTYGGVTPAEAAATIVTVARANLSFCLFMPYHGSSEAVRQLARSYTGPVRGLKSDDGVLPQRTAPAHLAIVQSARLLLRDCLSVSLTRRCLLCVRLLSGSRHSHTDTASCRVHGLATGP